MSPWNVRVSIIEPGSFSTSLMDGDKAERIIRGHWESLSEEIKEDYSEEYLERSKESLVNDCQNTEWHKTMIMHRN